MSTIKISIIKIITYITTTNKEPFTDWLNGLDKKQQAIILTRLDRIRSGNFGDCKQLDSIWELRIPSGPGYRIYFGKLERTIVLLLTGGDKGSQKRDIVRAKNYWLQYKDYYD